MKSFSLSIILICIFVLSCKNKNNSVENVFKKNNVKSAIQLVYVYEKDSASKKKSQSTTIEYNEEGEVVTENNFDEVDKIYLQNINHYNDQNQLIASDCIMPEPYSQHGVDSFFYDIKGKKILGKHYNALPCINQTLTKFIYDKNNNNIRCETYNHAGDTLLYLEKNEFDNKNHLLNSIFCGVSQKISAMTTKSTYNSKGQLIMEVHQWADFPETSTTKYFYDNRGLCIGTKIYHNDGIIVKETTLTYTFY